MNIYKHRVQIWARVTRVRCIFLNNEELKQPNYRANVEPTHVHRTLSERYK
jgi:hypothetical protein